MIIKEVSTDLLLDKRQIGWVVYGEGDAVLKTKVVRAPNGEPFISHVTCFHRGITVRTVIYPDKDIWRKKSEFLLQEFRKAVGEEHYLNFRRNEGKEEVNV